MLKPPFARRRALLETARRERGQTLVLFVALFTVVLVMGAFAVDQGMWLGKRRVSQKDADTAARGGAIAFLAKYNDLSGAQDVARRVADKNLAGNDSQTTFVAKQDCTDYKGNTTSGVHSLEAQINQPQGGLFARIFSTTAVNVGARATACVGQPSELSGNDAFYVAPGEDSPDPKCFDDDGNPLLGSICPLIVSSSFQDTGSRGLLSLQHDPANAGGGSLCTEPSNNNVDWQVVKGSNAICQVGDQVLTKQTTLEGIKFDVLCRLNGYANDSSDCKKVPTNPGFPASQISSASDAPGNVCDDDFHVSGTKVPPFASQLTPAFPNGDVRNSPSGLDDFQEVFSKPPPGGPPTSLSGSQFLIPNLCSGPGGRTYISPRIATVIIATEPPAPSGKITIKRFATFYILGCQELAPKSKTTLAGPIDPYCKTIKGSTTNLVGIFVRAFIPAGSGDLTPCDSDCIGVSIVLVK